MSFAAWIQMTYLSRFPGNSEGTPRCSAPRTSQDPVECGPVPLLLYVSPPTFACQQTLFTHQLSWLHSDAVWRQGNYTWHLPCPHPLCASISALSDKCALGPFGAGGEGAMPPHTNFFNSRCRVHCHSLTRIFVSRCCTAGACQGA